MAGRSRSRSPLFDPVALDSDDGESSESKSDECGSDESSSAESAAATTSASTESSDILGRAQMTVILGSKSWADDRSVGQTLVKHLE